jgi:transcription initiation factor TFIIF subunit alpha
MASNPPSNPLAAASKPPASRIIKRKPPINPLMVKRRPQPPKTAPPVSSNGVNTASSSSKALTARPTPARADFTQRPRSPTPEGELKIYPIYASGKTALPAIRVHIARMQSKKDVDIRDTAVFTRPVKLYRRDPTANPDDPASEEDVEMLTPEAAQQKQQIDAIKAERDLRREETKKQIAPTAAKKKKDPNKRRMEVARGPETAEEEKRRTLRYEEALPWHLEDFDNKHIWVGAYEASLSDAHVILTMDNQCFNMVPVEKFYRFKEKANIERLSSDAIEASLKKRVKEPRWFMAAQQKQVQTKYVKEAATTSLYKRSGEKAGGKDEPWENEGMGGGDGEEIDFDAADLFDDDEENELFEGDQHEQEEAKKKIQKEQLKANFFDINDANEVDEEEERGQKLAELQRQLEKGTKKVLVKRDENALYEDSDEENPYTEVCHANLTRFRTN